MASPSIVYRPTHSWSLGDLSSELLALIFEQLRDIDLRALATARCICRRFDAIATPISYQTVVLTEKIIAPGAEQSYPRTLQHIFAHTSHVIVRSDLDPHGIRRLLGKIHSLQSIRWCYVGDEFRTDRMWVPSDVLSPQHSLLSRTKLYIEELPLRSFEGEQRDTYLRAIPTDHLVSLKLASPTPPLATRLHSLKQLLLASRRLETLHYQDRGQGTQFSFSGSERLPAFKELALKSYDWNHDRDEVNAHWDFSRIRSLEIISIPVFNFLISVSFPDFADLENLHVEDFSAHVQDRRKEATQGLYILVKHHIRALRSFQVTCHTALFPIDAILAHAHSLETLRFRDYVGFAEEDRRCPTLWVDDLAMLASSMRSLQTLELDMDTAYTDPPLFLRALCSFPRLHTLTLHVQTVLHAEEYVYPGTDRDRDAAMQTFGFLLTKKMGFVPWRSITINVGGWRRVMLRRLSESWREQNERGVFAERCFVLERSTAGMVTVREEKSVEMSIRDDYDEENSMNVDPEPGTF